MAWTGRLRQDASLIIDGNEFEVDPKTVYKSQAITVQPGDPATEFERRIVNGAQGWGSGRFSGAGQYDYGAPATLHQAFRWLPGAKITTRTHTTAPIGAVTFCEYWDGTDAARRLIIISPRHIYEVNASGTTTMTDMGAGFTTTTGMTKGVRFRGRNMASPKVYIARPSPVATDYMVERTGANTYIVSPNNKYAASLGVIKDIDGEDALVRIDENGRLNYAIPDNNPSTPTGWAAASYSIGETSVRATDVVQQGRVAIIGREDGAWTFDNVLNSIPITVGMQHTPDARNFRYFKDFNGLAVAPTVQGIVWIDGLTWGVCGPVSANQEARSIVGREVAISHQAGRYIYCAVWDGATSWIFMGTPRTSGGTGEGPLVWHGPVASLNQEVTDLHVSTVWGKRLWIGYMGGWATIDLQDDFSPVTDQASGYIYLPEGILDMDGPGVIKGLREVEFIAPVGRPFSATNQWGIEVNSGSGWTAPSPALTTSGTVSIHYWTTETAARRWRVRLRYTGNTGNAELEQVILRGTHRPETAYLYEVQVMLRGWPAMPSRKRLPTTARAQLDLLRSWVNAGWRDITLAGEQFKGEVVDVKEVGARPMAAQSPIIMANVSLRLVKLS